MRDTPGLQPVDCRCFLCRVATDQNAGRRNKDGIAVVGLGPSKDMVHAPFGQHWIDQAEAHQEIDDKAWIYPRWALPWLLRRYTRCGIARQCLDELGGRARQSS